MSKKTHRWIARLAMPLALALAGCPPPNHDDDDNGGGDDDSAVSDDDDTTGSAGDDDDTSTGDDDNMEDYGPRSDNGAAPYHPDVLE